MRLFLAVLLALTSGAKATRPAWHLRRSVTLPGTLNPATIGAVREVLFVFGPVEICVR